MPTYVWVVESGDYEQRCISRIHSSLEKAVEGIKKQYGPPYIITWRELQVGDEENATLIGDFESVMNYSIRHAGEFDITRWEVDEE